MLVRRVISSILLMGVAGQMASAVAGPQPNVVVIVADDMGWGDLSCHGNTNLATPHLDALGKSGAAFDRFFVQPVCAPTRAEFLTGRYHPRGGVRGVSTGKERLDLDEKTIAEAFRAAGYATGYFGKWHNGSQYPYHPNGRGFDEYYGFTSGHWGDYFDPPLDHNGQAVRGEGYFPDDLTTRAIKFIGDNAATDQRFFCYVAYNTPHSPMQVPDRYWKKFAGTMLKQRATNAKQEDGAHTRAALAMCENLDENVGRLVAALGEHDATGETIVVFVSDNGPNGARWNGGMKGIKGSTDEGGVRSPLFVNWPGRIRGESKIESIAAAIDLYPTLAALAGVPVVAARPLEGVDLSPLLLETGAAPPPRVLYQHWGGKVSARTQRHRLDAAGRLFDMVADPGQTRDVSAREPMVAKELQASVDKWRREVLAESPADDDRPFPVGYSAQPTTTLPARDGTPHGGVQRSASAPNCSYFTNWRSLDDRMTWDVEVAEPGRYEVVIEYTSRAGDVGAAVELALDDAKWTGTIAEAHDPPLRGHEHDRVLRRGESYVKDFKPLSLGVVDLPKGRGRLILRATSIPGSQVADLRSVTLIRTSARSARE